MLIGQGFKCIGQTLNHGLLAGKNVYLWIRKNINDPNPILNVAVTMGHKKNPKDPIHFPPFYGYKRCPGMVNNGGVFSLDVFLWYRKTAFTTDADRGKLRTSKDGFSPDAEMNTQIINHVRQVLREHCMFGDGKVDLARGFKKI